MHELAAEIRAASLALTRALILIVLFGLVSWPFGGPFHLLHLLISPLTAIAGWPGHPGG